MDEHSRAEVVRAGRWMYFGSLDGFAISLSRPIHCAYGRAVVWLERNPAAPVCMYFLCRVISSSQDFQTASHNCPVRGTECGVFQYQGCPPCRRAKRCRKGNVLYEGRGSVKSKRLRHLEREDLLSKHQLPAEHPVRLICTAKSFLRPSNQ